MSDELKPCPFCGKVPKNKSVSIPYDIGRPARITQCECGVFLNVSRWNNRPIEDALRAELAAMTARLALAEAVCEAYERLDDSDGDDVIVPANEVLRVRAAWLEAKETK